MITIKTHIYKFAKVEKMQIIKYSLILFLLIGCQNSEKKGIVVKKEIGLLEGDSFNAEDSLFLELINKEVIRDAEEKKYISNISKLKSIKLINCDSKSIHYKDMIDNKAIEFKLSLKKFDKEIHTIKYINDMIDENWCELIDGKEPWGGIYGHPKTEIDKIEVVINGKSIEMKNELSDVFDFQMCEFDYRIYFNPNPLLKYDKENEVFYLYIKGGNAADNYFGKFVFDENQFIKRYLLHYGQLSETGSFKMNFKGF